MEAANSQIALGLQLGGKGIYIVYLATYLTEIGSCSRLEGLQSAAFCVSYKPLEPRQGEPRQPNKP